MQPRYISVFLISFRGKYANGESLREEVGNTVINIKPCVHKADTGKATWDGYEIHTQSPLGG